MKYRVRLNSIIVRWNVPLEEARAYAILLVDQVANRCRQELERATTLAQMERLRQGQANEVKTAEWHVLLEEDPES